MLLLFYFEKQRVQEWQRRSFHPLVHSPDTENGYEWATLKPEGSQELNPGHLFEWEVPNYFSQHHWLPGPTLAESLSRV